MQAEFIASKQSHLSIMRVQRPKGTKEQHPNRDVISVNSNGIEWTISRRTMSKYGTWVLANAYGEGFGFTVEGFCDAPKDSKMVSDAIKIITSAKPEK